MVFTYKYDGKTDISFPRYAAIALPNYYYTGARQYMCSNNVTSRCIFNRTHKQKHTIWDKIFLLDIYAEKLKVCL